MGAHLVERGQLLAWMVADDRALADAVAAADLRHRPAWRRHPAPAACRRPASAKARPNTSCSRSAETSVLVAHQLEIPGAVGDIAVQHRADQLVVAHHELLVDAAAVVAQRDLVVGFVGRHQRAGREHIDAGDLEAGGQRLRRRHSALLVAGQTRGADLGLVPERRHQAEDLAAMLDAFAHREDVGIGGAHVVVDHDAAVDVEPAPAWPGRYWGGCRSPSRPDRPVRSRPSASCTPSARVGAE